MVRLIVDTASDSDVAQFVLDALQAFTIDPASNDREVILSAANGCQIIFTGRSFTYPTPDSVSGTADGLLLFDSSASLFAHGNRGKIDIGVFLANAGGSTAQQLVNLLGTVDFFGNNSADLFSGTAKMDRLYGNGGDDMLSGEHGNDTIVGGAGADRMSGGKGTDTLSYVSSSSGVIVSLLGAASGGDAEGDVFDGFENLVGSSHNDELKGSDGDNSIEGGAGDDVIVASGGLDRLIGGEGSDTISFSESTVAVYVDLTLSAAGFENVKGSSHDDTLSGGWSWVNSVLDGAEGNDRLYGKNATTLIGGGGADTFVLDSNRMLDRIVDFQPGEDQLEVAAAAFGTLVRRGLLDVNETGLAERPATRFVFNTVTGELVFDENGSRGGRSHDPFIVAKLEGDVSLFSVDDFLIV